MAIMNRLLQLLCVSLIASSTVAAPAPERPKLERGTVSRVEVREFIEHIDRDAVQSLVEKLRTARADLKDRDFALSNGLSFVKRQDVSPGASDTVTDGPTSTETETTDPPSSTTESDTNTDTSSQTDTEPTSSEPEPTSTDTPPTTTSTDEPTSSTDEPTSGPTSTSEPTSTDTPTSPTSSDPTSSTSTTEPTSTETSSTIEPTSSEEPTTTTESTSSSSISTFTSTDANGDLVTVTSTAVVNPTQGPDDNGTETGPEPGLQTNGASASGYARELFVMMGGAAVAVAVI
ncbi:putative GPI anchored cell wall protein (Dan4) [Aspergillus puulaauensis]|uniref:GPI anchored protein n=1 Tax=Aspergillus puulaauensis TaxID=1220207 RepID=A0A7R7XY94_9EURO|nr:uncharacterized protein APUU_80250S [Aspergillus puulaauensis]BCS29947.1 hypothetical protein APUU_80250S [Aspergillus puulaauensis]